MKKAIITTGKNKKGQEEKFLIVTGPCKWASVINPNTKFDPVWSIDMVELDDSQVKVMEDAGLSENIKDKGEGKFITFKQKVKLPNGDDAYPPKVVDTEQNDFDSLIGNGSIVTAKARLRDYNAAGKQGIALDLKKVMVRDLIEFTPEYIEEGFEVAAIDLDELPIE